MTTTEVEELARELRGIHMGWDGDTPAGHIFSDDPSAVIAARTAIEFLTALGYRRISPTDGKCFECGSELEAPRCPKCNPEKTR